MTIHVTVEPRRIGSYAADEFPVQRFTFEDSDRAVAGVS
jgi:hypothetical protein